MDQFITLTNRQAGSEKPQSSDIMDGCLLWICQAGWARNYLPKEYDAAFKP